MGMPLILAALMKASWRKWHLNVEKELPYWGAGKCERAFRSGKEQEQNHRLIQDLGQLANHYLLDLLIYDLSICSLPTKFILLMVSTEYLSIRVSSPL